jgi:hypothetical protein
MRSIAYASVLAQVYGLLNLVAADATAADKTKINAFIQRRTRDAFQKYWWAETMRSEERWFRPFYSAGTAYAAPTATTASEVFHAGSRGYYQALRATTGNAPATLSGGSWTVNTAYWAPIAENYAAADWADATAYVAGDTVRSLDDARFYRCHTAHTSSGTLDATKFGLLTEWLPTISLDQTGQTAIGLVRGCFLDNPNRDSNPRRVKSGLGPGGVHLFENTRTSCFVWFQTVPPILSGADYAAGTAYAAGAVMYYASATAGYEGDFWKCLATTTAGQNPETHAAKWERQEIPEGLRDAIAHAVYSDYLRPVGKDDAVPMEDTAGGQFLMAEMYKAVAMQRQAGRWAQG